MISLWLPAVQTKTKGKKRKQLEKAGELGGETAGHYELCGVLVHHGYSVHSGAG